MNLDIINRKLESLRRCVARIHSKMPLTQDNLQTDYDLQDIVSVNLERAVQTCVDIAAHMISETEASPPNTMAESFSRLAALKFLTPQLAERMRKAVGLRNILVHHYTDIDQYCGQNLGRLFGNNTIVAKGFVLRAGFFQTQPVS